MSVDFLQSVERPFPSVKPWIINFYKRLNDIDIKFTEDRYVQCLKVNTIPAGKEYNYAIVVLSDSEIQLYAQYIDESLPDSDRPFFNELRGSVGSIVRIKKFSFSIDRLHAFLPPIMIVYSYDILSGSYTLPQGIPGWIQEKGGEEHTINLKKSRDFRSCLQQYNRTFPDDFLLHEQNRFQQNTSDNIPLSTQLYSEFHDFSLVLDQCILSQMLKDDSSNLSFSDTFILEISNNLATINNRNANISKIAKEAHSESIPNIDSPAAASNVVEKNSLKNEGSNEIPGFLKEAIEDDIHSSENSRQIISNNLENLDKSIIVYLEKYKSDMIVGKHFLNKICKKLLNS